MLCALNARQLCMPVSRASALLFSVGQIMLLYIPPQHKSHYPAGRAYVSQSRGSNINVLVYSFTQ